MAQLPKKSELIINTFSTSSSSKATSTSAILPTSQPHANVNTEAITSVANVGANSQFPPFFIMFNISNYNVHNCLVYFGASTNVMPLSICRNINVNLENTDANIIQLDRFQIQMVRELKYVLIWLASDSRMHQFTKIVVLDIHEACGFLLGRDCSSNIQGCFFFTLVSFMVSL